ncbi:MAG TPA: ketopantoate reductase family protein [Dongiaceae bacterium]|nr:ketopantoate reductase family protein [Dongiaceae bacterium]
MKFAILGAGAVGCYYGAMLARAGHGVTMIGRPAQVDAIRAHGLRVDAAAFQAAVPVRAVADPGEAGPADIALVCVKSTDTESAGRALAPFLAADTAVFSFQNGVDNGDRLQAVLDRPVVPVAVYVAAEMIGPGHVRHHGRGDVVLGASPASERFAAALNAAGVPAAVSDNVRESLWRKLMTNCCYNALSAVAQLPYGRLMALPAVREVMRDVVDECLAVARASGIVLAADPLPEILAVADAMSGQLSSTAQDLARGKVTEIEHLNGFVLRAGAARGIPTPANRALYAMVKLAEIKAGHGPAG